MVESARKRVMRCVFVSRASTPKQCGAPETSSVTKSTARWCSKNEMLPVAAAAARRARSISAPVRSAACTMRRSECPPSRVRCSEPSALRVKAAPSWTSSRTRAGPSRQTTSTALVVGWLFRGEEGLRVRNRRGWARKKVGLGAACVKGVCCNSQSKQAPLHPPHTHPTMPETGHTTNQPKPSLTWGRSGTRRRPSCPRRACRSSRGGPARRRRRPARSACSPRSRRPWL
jgi:hypothetical protein